MTLPDLPAAPGAYVLLLTANAPVVLNMPRFGKFTLAAGQYAYVGSAHGPGGLRARVGRHLRAEKPLHWHIDYLTAALPVMHVIIVVVTNGARLECTWVRRPAQVERRNRAGARLWQLRLSKSLSGASGPAARPLHVDRT